MWPTRSAATSTRKFGVPGSLGTAAARHSGALSQLSISLGRNAVGTSWHMLHTTVGMSRCLRPGLRVTYKV